MTVVNVSGYRAPLYRGPPTRVSTVQLGGSLAGKLSSPLSSTSANVSSRIVSDGSGASLGAGPERETLRERGMCVSQTCCAFVVGRDGGRVRQATRTLI